MKASSMYQKIIAALKAINPRLKVIGLTATWYRLGQGLLTDQGLFTDICYNICDVDGFTKLIHDGYLCPPIPTITKTVLDISGVSINAASGDFNQGELQKAVDKHDVTYAALSEACQMGKDRKSWLVFCSGVEHSEHCAEMLRAFGLKCEAVHSKISDSERDRIINAFKTFKLDAVTNNNVLTTGFDHPPIDYIPVLRPTTSPNLWVQMLGRGTRISPETDKENCLCPDFAGNARRLGPINDPVIPKRKGPGSGEVPVKICDHCGAYNHISARVCILCGAPFEIDTKITRKASTIDLINWGVPQVEWFNVDRVIYNRHVSKSSGVPTVRVSYMCGLNLFNEYICFDHQGLARHKANEWWRQRHESEPPLSTDIALSNIARMLRTPRRIQIHVNIKPQKVLRYEF